MCELQDSCQMEHHLLNTSSEEMRVGLVQQGEAKPPSQLSDGSWLLVGLNAHLPRETGSNCNFILPSVSKHFRMLR